MLFWLLLSIALAATVAWQIRLERQHFLPVARQPQRIVIHADLHDTTLEFTDGQWRSAGKAANAQRIADWLELLRACQGNYREEDITPPPDAHPVQIHIDGELYQLGAANPFANAHYITHHGRAYLCEQSVKATLRLPADLWLEKPDA